LERSKRFKIIQLRDQGVSYRCWVDPALVGKKYTKMTCWPYHFSQIFTEK
jgi:hypothetical protein